MENNITNFLYIKKPEIKGNQVFFNWHLNYDEEKTTNSIYVDYYDLDISNVPLQVHYNTIIGLLLNKLRYSKIDTIVVTEDCIAQEITEFWTSYHHLNNVYFSNTASIHIEKSNSLDSKGSVGILYGGGKDSYYALDILSKNDHIKKINLVSFVIPDAHVNVKQLEDRRDNLILKPIADKYDINVIKIRTDARSIVKGYHLELYFAPLGVLAWLNKFEFVTFSYEYCHYFIPSNNHAEFGFERSQISYINALSEFYSKYLSKKNITVFNANQHLSELSSFGYLAKNNPSFYKTLVMCESTVDKNKKWCCSCTKCAEFTLFSLFYDLKQTDIDVDWFFSESPWINKIIEQLNTNTEKGKFFRGLTFTLHFDSFKFVITKLKDRGIQFNNTIANRNFDTLVEHYYDNNINNEDCFYYDIFNLVYPPKLRKSAFYLLDKVLPMALAPKEKSSGLGQLHFDSSIQPKLIDVAPKIDPSIVFKKMTKAAQFTKFNSDSSASYIKECNIKTLGALNAQEVTLLSNEHYIDVWINKDPLQQEDGYVLAFYINASKNFTHASFKLEIPYVRDDLSERFICELTINDKILPISLSEERNLTCHFPIVDKNHKVGNIPIILSMKASKNLEPWKWGNACRIRISDLNLYSNKEQYKINKSTAELGF